MKFRQPNRVLLQLSLLLIVSAINFGLFTSVISSLSLTYKSTLVASAAGPYPNNISAVIFGTSLFALFSPIQAIILPAIGSYSDFIGRKSVLLACLILTAIGYLFAFHSIQLHSKLLLFSSLALANFSLCIYPIIFAIFCDLSSRVKLAQYLVLAPILYSVVYLADFVGNYCLFRIHYLPDNLILTGFIISLLSVLFVASLNLPKRRYQQAVPRQKSFLRDFIKQFERLAFSKSNIILFGLIVIFLYGWGLSDRSIPPLFATLKLYSNPAVNLRNTLTTLFLVALVYPWLIKHFNLSRLLIVGISLVVLGIVFILTGYQKSLLGVYSLVISVSENMLFAMLLYVLVRSTNAKNYGLTMGLFFAIDHLVWCLSNITTTQASSYVHTLSTALVMILVFFILMLWYLYKYRYLHEIKWLHATYKTTPFFRFSMRFTKSKNESE